MAIKSIYHSQAGQAEMMRLYDLQVSRLGFPVEDCTVPTRFGSTHMLLAGPATGRPLVCFHGGNSINPLSLSALAPLTQKYRIIAPDTPGHPGKSVPLRLSPRNDDYGEWVVDLLNALGLERAVLIGGSYGAGIILRAAVLIPDRMEKLILFVPSGIVSIPFSTMIFRLLIPLSLYRLSPSRAGLIRTLQPMFAKDPIPEDVIDITQATFDHVKVEPEMPRNITPVEMARLAAPILVITAEKDYLFPATRVLKRAQRVFPNLTACETIPGSPHYISPRHQAYLCDRIGQFIESGQ